MTLAANYILYAPDRVATLGSLAIDAFVYDGEVGDSASSRRLYGRRRPVEGLSVRILGREAEALYHTTTGLYGFVELAPGPVRVHVTDPAARFLPMAMGIEVPNRSAQRRALERSDSPAKVGAGPLYTQLAMRPAPGAPLAHSPTAIWGRVLDNAGQPVPLARLELATEFPVGQDFEAGRIVSFSDFRGDYVLVSPGERPQPGAGDDETVEEFARALRVDRLRADSEARRHLRSDRSLLALPTEMEPTAAHEQVDFQLVDPATADQRADALVRVARRVRWDVHLTA